MTMMAEEEEIRRDWNEELLGRSTPSSSIDSVGPGRDAHAAGMTTTTTAMETASTQIAGTHVLSPHCDGTVVSPYRRHRHRGDAAVAVCAGAVVNDDGEEEEEDRRWYDADLIAHVASGGGPTTITYVLRGSGFDLPSLADAAHHRRRTMR